MIRPLIVGSGVAGLWTAWRLADLGTASILVTKDALGESASAWAQGGIAAALGPDDSPALHAQDTIAAGGGFSDPEAVAVLTSEGPDRIRELIGLGATFDRLPDGTLGFGLEAAHSRRRILHAEGDRTGAEIVRALTAVVRALPGVEILEFTEARQLLKKGDVVTGLRLERRLPGEEPATLEIATPATLLATGGVGQLYAVTTNPLGSTGDGWALADEAGAELADLELLQFHPTALRMTGLNPAPLLSEALRGAGAHLVDWMGQRFAFEFDERGELAPRDVVARAVAYADAEGGAFLDARHMPDFAREFPGIHAMLLRVGLDPARQLLPVAPALHYAMGGIVTDLEGRTTLPGLWAAGEVARTGVHGANRLASNSLLEGLVFADRAARSMRSKVEGHRSKVKGRTSRVEGRTSKGPGPEPDPAITSAMREIMTGRVGLARTEESLLAAGTELEALASRVAPADWRTHNRLRTSRLIARSALERRESRGGHRRVDFPPADMVRHEGEPLGLD